MVEALHSISRLPAVAVELVEPSARQVMGDAVERVGASRMRQVERDKLCKACDVLGLEVPSRTNPDAFDDGGDGSGGDGGDDDVDGGDDDDDDGGDDGGKDDDDGDSDGGRVVPTRVR